MKAELTPELKEQFFALYWGQKVICLSDPIKEDYIVHGYHVDIMRYNPEAYLSLRGLSSITDEEALGLCQVLDPEITSDETPAIKDYKTQLIRSFLEIDYTAKSSELPPVRIAWAMEYLRSLGFAVPFMGNTVEEMIAAGWIKLT